MSYYGARPPAQKQTPARRAHRCCSNPAPGARYPGTANPFDQYCEFAKLPGAGVGVHVTNDAPLVGSLGRWASANEIVNSELGTDGVSATS